MYDTSVLQSTVFLFHVTAPAPRFTWRVRLGGGLNHSGGRVSSFVFLPVTFVSASVLRRWQADTKASFHPCSSSRDMTRHSGRETGSEWHLTPDEQRERCYIHEITSSGRDDRGFSADPPATEITVTVSCLIFLHFAASDLKQQNLKRSFHILLHQHHLFTFVSCTFKLPISCSTRSQRFRSGDWGGLFIFMKLDVSRISCDLWRDGTWRHSHTITPSPSAWIVGSYWFFRSIRSRLRLWWPQHYGCTYKR